ncbi:MAG: hypothetical protein ABSB68_15545 [Acidimicrobiales bacterium]|jgi:hypothetical protein
MTAASPSPSAPDFLLKFAKPDLVSAWAATVTARQSIEMMIWLLQRYTEGPPPTFGHSGDDLLLAEGPNGEWVEFIQESKASDLGVETEPPVGAVIIHSINGVTG